VTEKELPVPVEENRAIPQSFEFRFPLSIWPSIVVSTGTDTGNFLRQLPKFLYLLEHSVGDGPNHDLSLLSRSQGGITKDS
jgi:hypothetical protein